MLKIIAKTTTSHLKIKKSMSRLFQAFIYHNIDSKEHDGHKSPHGRIFKAMNFKIIYQRDFFTIYFTALNKGYEDKIAFIVLKNGLKLGNVHFSETTIEMKKRETEQNKISVRGYVTANIKDDKGKIWLEPRYNKFIKVVTNNSIEKYETFLGKYEDEIKIEMIEQKRDKRLFFYGYQPIESWLATYKITATSKMINLLLDVGMGGNAMKGVGFLEIEG